MNPKCLPISLYCILSNDELIKRIQQLESEIFKVIPITDLNDLDTFPTENAVIIVERTLYTDTDHRLTDHSAAIIIVSDTSLNLRDEIIHKVPKDLFLTKYLEQFIYWTVEKTHYMKEIQEKKAQRDKRISALITELHDTSRQSIYYDEL